MCGFIMAPGYYGDLTIYAAMRRMEYRGADGFQGISRRGGWTLGHVRLAIQTSEDEGAQPFEAEGSSLAFVGEIFDPEVLEEQALFAALGSPSLSGFHYLDGFWALAQIFDSGRARVITDHLGIKPLYYWADYGIVCSEIEPMFELEPAPELDEVYLSTVLRFGFDWSGRTPYKGITQVAPGTCLRFDPITYSEATAVQYWDWKKVPVSGRTLREDLDEAIRNRVNFTNSDALLLLSGGLDSSIIYYSLLNQGYNPLAYSVENGESEFLPPGVTPLRPVASTPETYLEAVARMQTPVDLGSLFPQIQLAKNLGLTGSRVCLTGDGADEVFGGYRRAADFDSQHHDVFCELPYYHLPRLDRILMRSTIELRSPYLAPAVVKAGLMLPRDLRTEKQALKQAYADLLPSRILERKKHPLKSPEVLTDPLTHRIKLVEAFREYADQFRL